MNGKESIANGHRVVSFFKKIAKGEKVAFGFRHFFAVHKQVFRVEPVFYELFSGLAVLVFLRHEFGL